MKQKWTLSSPPKFQRIQISFLAFLILMFFLSFPIFAAEDNAINSSEQEIWDYLVDLTGNPKAAAGIMGNLYYESALNPVAVQHSDGIILDPEVYTMESQLGIHENFATDGYGYGLAQWTYPRRKLRLLELADAQSCYIGDVSVQLQLLGEELENYHMLYRISHTDSIQFASDYFLKHYENPRIQNEEIHQQRARKGQYYYDKYTNPVQEVPQQDNLTQAQKDVIQIASHSDAYNIPAEKGYCMAWVTAVYREAGHSMTASPSALASAESFSMSEDLSDIPLGAAIYGKHNDKYGHIGLYVGNGVVFHNANGAVSDTLEDWIRQYDGFCWGWPGGIDLTALP